MLTPPRVHGFAGAFSFQRGLRVAKQKMMRRFAKWHIWLGWLAGLPLVMWTFTGLIMVARPIEEVRGNHLRTDKAEAPLSTFDATAGFAALAQFRERPIEISFRINEQNRH